MDVLLKMTPMTALLWCILLVVATLCIICLIYVIVRGITKLARERAGFKAGPFALTSPQDHINFNTDELARKDNTNNTDDWSRHPYFLLLEDLKVYGAKVVCSSYVKSQFINEYLKIYAGTMHDELLDWVQKVSSSNGKDLSEISSIMNKVEMNSQNHLLDAKINIKFKERIFQVNIPKFLVDRFTHQYSFTQSAGFDTLGMALDSKFYSGWKEELGCILGQLYTIIKTNFVGMNCAIKTLNGELDEYLDRYVNRYFQHELIADYVLNNSADNNK